MTRVAVIGAGLAGLVAALRLAEGGARVTVFARGAGGLHLSPGVIDVLGYAPERVDSPRDALPGFAADRPGHPYGVLAGPPLEEALEWFRAAVAPLRYGGDTSANMLLPTAVGVARPTALAPASMTAADLRHPRRLLAVGLRSLKDFFPRLVADNLAHAGLDGVEVRHAEASWSPRPGVDVQGQYFARALDEPAAREALASELRRLAEPGETILLPAVVGLRAGAEAWEDLCARAGAPVAEVPILPPSVPGMRLQRALTGALTHAGGRMVIGPEAVGCEGAGGRITAVLIRDAARARAVPADAVVLATGGFESGGIELDSYGALREAALGLPVAGPADGAPLFAPHHLGRHPVMEAGVRVDDRLRPVAADGSAVWGNLYAAGSVVAGAQPWREKSGEGIAIAGAHRAARTILEET